MNPMDASGGATDPGLSCPIVEYPEKESNNPRKALENGTLRKQVAQNPAQLPTKPSDSTPIDPDLARVVRVWSTLPEGIRNAITAIIGSVAPPTGS